MDSEPAGLLVQLSRELSSRLPAPWTVCAGKLSMELVGDRPVTKVFIDPTVVNHPLLLASELARKVEELQDEVMMHLAIPWPLPPDGGRVSAVATSTGIQIEFVSGELSWSLRELRT